MSLFQTSDEDDERLSEKNQQVVFKDFTMVVALMALVAIRWVFCFMMLTTNVASTRLAFAWLFVLTDIILVRLGKQIVKFGLGT